MVTRKRVIAAALLLPVGLIVLWFGASVVEWGMGIRLFPWSAYAGCGSQVVAVLPETVTVGFYEEFPVEWRLNKLEQVDFPVKLAVAATSRAEYLQLSEGIRQTYPQVQETYFWGLLSPDEGYYPGSWSDADAVERLANESEGLPVLWDLEVPRGLQGVSLENWRRNTIFLDQWLKAREQPVHIWRTHTSMGLDPLFLRLVGMHYDPLDYPAVSLHLDLYMTGAGMPDQQLSQILRCGVERYGERFIPSLGVLNDGEGELSLFIPPETFRRVLKTVRASGVSEVWLFGVNGLNADYLSILRETLPLASLNNAA